MLDSLATLKPQDLQRGEWCFVSFPAQLLALSVLSTISDPDSRYFEADFWNTRDVCDDKKERQREVLKIIENRRHDHHLKQSAGPVRFIYVAWCVIKIEEKILFYHREDKTRHEKKSGNYGLPGGRVNQQDLIDFGGNMQDKLRLLQSTDHASIKPALNATLKRELMEEIGLEYEQHYFFDPWRTLKTYRQVQGAGPNHALTEYHLNIFEIKLTLEGYCFLQQEIADNEKLIWFTLEEVAQGQTSDGKIAYIEALFKDFDDDRTSLKQALENLKDSFEANYLNCQQNYRIVLPRDEEGQRISAGVRGKEAAIDLPLNQHQVSLLLGMAAHLRGFDFLEKAPSIIVHPYGWIEVEENCDLQIELIKLVETCKDSKDVVVENQKNRWIRLSISPECVFFDDAYFRCSYYQKDLQNRQNKVCVTAIRRQFITRLGTVAEDKKEAKISTSIIKSLDKLMKGEQDDSLAISVRGSYRKSPLHDGLSSLGMRGLLRQDAGAVRIFCEIMEN
ncbi:MAG: NUDIX domain-containing protein [Nitrosomonas halophila]